MRRRDDAEALRISHWRQGYFVKHQDVSEVLGSSIDHVNKRRTHHTQSLILLTQDCDLVQNLEKEPFVEFIAGYEVSSHNPSLFHGKNPRRLQVQAIANDRKQEMLDISIHDRFRIPKQELLRLSPDGDRQLSVRDRKLLTGWIAKRYTRHAFPDEFNRRLRKSSKRMEKLFKTNSARRIIWNIFSNNGLRTPRSRIV